MADNRNYSKFIPEAYNPNKQAQVTIKAQNVVPAISGSPADSHQHRSGLIAQKFSNAKDHTFKNGYFQP